jgi:hypothetical protein
LCAPHLPRGAFRCVIISLVFPHKTCELIQVPGYKQLSTLGNVVSPKNEFIFSFLVSGKIVHTQKILYQNGCSKLQFIQLG